MKRQVAPTNPFYQRVQREGLHIINDCAVREGISPTNPYYERIRRSGGIRLQVHRGRPRAGEKSIPTVTKSIRLPPAIWKRLEAQAKREGKTLHAALRQAVLIWLRS